MTSTSIAHRMPMELVDIIFTYLVEFHRYDATERVHAVRDTYRGPWSLVMSDVRANIPRYTLTFTDYEGQPISIYSPDCFVHWGGPPSRRSRLGLPLGCCQATPNPWQVITRNAMSTLPTRRSPRTYLPGTTTTQRPYTWAQTTAPGPASTWCNRDGPSESESSAR